MCTEDTFEITGKVIRTTEKAILCEIPVHFNRGNESQDATELMWFPKSQVEIYETSIIVPQWLIDRKEIELKDKHGCEVSIL